MFFDQEIAHVTRLADKSGNVQLKQIIINISRMGPYVALRVGLRILALTIQNLTQAQLYTKREITEKSYPSGIVRFSPFFDHRHRKKIKQIKN